MGYSVSSACKIDFELAHHRASVGNGETGAKQISTPTTDSVCTRVASHSRGNRYHHLRPTEVLSGCIRHLPCLRCVTYGARPPTGKPATEVGDGCRHVHERRQRMLYSVLAFFPLRRLSWIMHLHTYALSQSNAYVCTGITTLLGTCLPVNGC